MECRLFELTLISAVDLENVRKLCKMKVYARVSIGGGDRKNEMRSPVDRHGRTNPAWNFMMKYTVGEAAVQHHGATLVIKLYCKRKLGDRYVGEVHLMVKDLYEYAYSCGGSAVVSYPVQKGCVNSQGFLKFSYRFGEKVSIDKLILAESFGAWTSSVV
ncbi:hypothetical protein LguiA_018147 [Lonicera macranthoides]